MAQQPCLIRKAAREAGETQYFTGRPCKRGHLSTRWTSGGACCQCRREDMVASYAAMDTKAKAEYMERSKIRTAANPASRLIVRAKVNARKRKVPFDLTIADILPLPTHCPVLGIPLTNNLGIKNRDSSYSLDRLIPSKGYVKGNVIVMSYRANAIKHDASIEELEALLAFLQSQ